MQGRSSEEHRRRLGLHRPVTALPRDRLSQVTRRGMLTYTKSSSSLTTAGQREEQREAGLNPGSSRETVVGRGMLRDPARMEEREEEPEDGAGAGVSAMDLLDNLSESGSSLSKIDWAAIESMVAAEDA
ncbi:hypothetical protein EYF80_008589 [Liparis tanakae]|uniref:Uncharacterized protein n=1 Tax=Liparis tanakae TaxID=230148 RepID=A0A4Z2ITN4_9TELE|nr:hypothetical protein EYF80_008589 [Liparis tanakae]